MTIFSCPCSLFPVPCSLFPTPYSRLPTPDSRMTIKMGQYLINRSSPKRLRRQNNCAILCS
ncbi:MAG: hypothetical protein F6K56_32965, partial [Moorea sp. SIO3G5]|nr:hypothetical protein [Moorena sp. SIO3G5]